MKEKIIINNHFRETDKRLVFDFGPIIVVFQYLEERPNIE